MVNNFLSYIEKEALLKKHNKVLLAVSSGVDSVVMAYLFQQTSIDFGIAHCNFQLRADESDEDELFVKSYANKLNKPFFNTRFNTKKYANDNGISTQMAARELRYNWFEKLLISEGYKYIATAHHINDSIETAIFNFSKGTGIAGLRGILPKTKTTIRPLLFASRTEIEHFANKHKLAWREDSSNQSDHYARNYIRHQIIPKLTELNPNLEVTAIHTMERLRDVENIFKYQVNKFKTKHISHKNNAMYIALHKTLELIGLKTILYEVLKEYGYNYVQITEMMKRRNEAGRIFKSKNYTLNIDRDQFIVTKHATKNPNFTCKIVHEDDIMISPYGTLKFDWQSKYPTTFSNDPTIAYIDIDLLKFPIMLRTWKTGDSFQPLGMENKKKLSDFMIDRKIPLNLKKNVMVLESNNKIIWVVGHQLDNRFKITQSTSTICRIEFTPIL